VDTTCGPKGVNCRWLSLAVSLAACLLLSSCGSSAKNIVLAKAAVEEFHSQLDTEEYGAIYDSTDRKFQNVTSQSDFTKLLTAVHQKLGTVQHTNTRNVGVAWYTGQGATVTLVYDTTFSAGTGTEQFVWHVNNAQATLYGYHIASNDLITK